MIVRTPSPSDRRSYGLHLTARGRRALATIGKLTVNLETQLFANLNRKEVGQLAALLSRVVDEQSLPPGVHAAYRQLDPPSRRRSSKRRPKQHTLVSKIHNGKNRA